MRCTQRSVYYQPYYILMEDAITARLFAYFHDKRRMTRRLFYSCNRLLKLNFWGGWILLHRLSLSIFLNETKISTWVWRTFCFDDGRFFFENSHFLRLEKKETRRKLPNQTNKKSCSPLLLLEKGLTLFHTYVENDIDIRSSRLGRGKSRNNWRVYKSLIETSTYYILHFISSCLPTYVYILICVTTFFEYIWILMAILHAKLSYSYNISKRVIFFGENRNFLCTSYVKMWYM